MQSGLPHRATTNTKHARDTDRLPDRIKRDMKLELDIKRVWKDNFRVYGARKVWQQLLLRGSVGVARCTG